MKKMVLTLLMVLVVGVGVSWAEEVLPTEINQLKAMALNGGIRAQYHLGTIYSLGYGVEKDMEQAIYWYTKAAENGRAEAQHFLGATYFFEDDFKNNKAAYMWVLLAVARSDNDAEKEMRFDMLQTIETEMTREEITEAQAMAAEWQRNFEAGGE